MEKFMYVIIVFIVNMIFTTFLSAIDDYDNRRIEKMWDLDTIDRKPPQIEKKQIQSKIQMPPFLSTFIPEKQEFQVIPQSDNTITGKYGSTVFIPANSISLPMNFRRGDIVVLELIELINDLDFLTAGLDLNYTDAKGTNYILESGGAVKLSLTYYSKPLMLKRGSRLKLNIPIRDNGKQMKVFKMDEIREAWSDRGFDEKAGTLADSKERVTGFMEDLQWWGFKNPNSETTCITGQMENAEKNPPYTVFVIGLDFLGTLGKNFTGNEFSINVPKDKKVKILVLDEKGNMGISQEIKTNSEKYYLSMDEKNTNKCMNIGSLGLKKVSTEIRQNRNKFINYLGLKDEM